MLLEPLARRSRIALTVDSVEPLPLALVDPNRLEQALTNIVGNALKSTPDEGSVQVRMRSQPADGSGPTGVRRSR